jgi:hypothetical protein
MAPATPAPHRSVAELVARFLQCRGIDRIFGLQGGGTSSRSGITWHSLACASSTCAMRVQPCTWRMPTPT